MAITLLITDFDGTLVDTFEANYQAYRQAFADKGRELTRERYRECFGFRFDRFMEAMKIADAGERAEIRELKSKYYPEHFDLLQVNRPLLEFLRSFRRSGGHTAIASTARERNLRNALRHIGAEDDFDLILAGESVTNGKPHPEIYRTVLAKMQTPPENALIFEDSEVGFQAAEAAGISYIRIPPHFFHKGKERM